MHQIQKIVSQVKDMKKFILIQSRSCFEETTLYGMCPVQRLVFSTSEGYHGLCGGISHTLSLKYLQLL